MKRLLSWLLALVMIISCLPMSALPAFAAEEKPEVDVGDTTADFEDDFSNLLEPTVPEPVYVNLTTERQLLTIAPGQYVYGVVDNTAGVYTVNAYSATSESWSMGLFRMFVSAPAAGEVATLSLADFAYEITAMDTLNITFSNTGEEDAYVWVFLTENVVEDTTGTMNDPAELVLGDNVTDIKAGNNQGYFYTYTAEKDGTLALTISSTTGWTYVVNNLTSGAYGEFQTSEGGANPALVEVSAGDKLEINVNTFNPADSWNTPAGTITVNAAYEADEPEAVWNIATSAYGLSLEAELVVSAKFAIPDELYNDADAVIKVQFIDQVTEYKMADFTRDSKNRILIEQSVRSPWMPHMVTVTITDGQGNVADYTDYFGDTYEGSYEFGAETYVKLTTVVATGESTINCIRGLLTYGAYAQEYFESTGSIPNIPEMRATEILTKYGYEPMDISQFSSDLLDQAPTSSGDSFDGISSRGVANPVLEAAIYMTFQFNATGITEADMDNYTYKLSYTSGTTLVEKEISPSWDSRGRLVFNITDIAAMYFDCMYSVTITKKATGESYTGSTSIIAYMDVAFDTYEGVASQAKFLNLLKAMYYYNQAANAHFNK